MAKNWRLAVELLARQDALFAPFRDFRDPPGCLDPARSVFGTLRRLFPRQGLPLPVADGYEAQQWQREHAGNLAEAGIIELFRPKGAKALGYRMTDAGEHQCRRKIDTEGLHATLRLVECIANEFGVGEFISENRILSGLPFTVENVDSVSTRAMYLQEDLCPALARGWVESTCQLTGNAFYSITPEGHSATLRGLSLPECPLSSELRAAYLEAFRASYTALRNMKPPEPSEIGLLHYPGSAVPA